jgi:hypothetical protein
VVSWYSLGAGREKSGDQTGVTIGVVCTGFSMCLVVCPEWPETGSNLGREKAADPVIARFLDSVG